MPVGNEIAATRKAGDGAETEGEPAQALAQARHQGAPSPGRDAPALPAPTFAVTRS